LPPRAHPSSTLFPYTTLFRSIDLNTDSFAALTEEVTLDALELPAGEKAVLSLQLPPQFIIVFEPVTHSAHFIDVQGEPTKERQRSEEHTSELQSPYDLVCRLL